MCGNCPHRLKHGLYKDCYVQPVTGGPSQIWKSYKKGNYEKYNEEKHLKLFKDRVIRLSAYGESVAAPLSIHKKIIEVAKTSLCYTHQWKDCPQEWRNYAMASVDSEEEYWRARQMGWRTFRIRREDEPLLNGEFACPASKEEGFRMTCEKCQSCRGLNNFSKSALSINRIASPSIIVHGVKRNNFVKLTREKEIVRAK